jgi:hypothetical protein
MDQHFNQNVEQTFVLTEARRAKIELLGRKLSIIRKKKSLLMQSNSTFKRISEASLLVSER